MERFYKFAFAAALLIVAVSASPKIGKSLQDHFQLDEDVAEPQSVIVSFTKGISNVIDQIEMSEFSDIVEKRTALREAQIKFSNGIQRVVQTFLDLRGVEYETLWINNKMHIPRADYRLVKLLAHFPAVVSIEKEKIAYISLPANIEAGASSIEDGTANVSSLAKQAGVTWGVAKIRAQHVWQNYTGRGVVVASIDSGVRVTHEALKSNWRKQYGWYDPFYATTTPNDQEGHGTHTMGTIAGANGIGVAPGSTWISCRGCSQQYGCPEAATIKCGQWILCPTLPNGGSANCAMAPNIVSNSWGGLMQTGGDFYNDVIKSWHAAEIIPVFAIGNNGPHCGTSASPGDQPNNIAVSNMDAHDRIHSSSSRGPNKLNQIRADIAAPGSNIRSAWFQADNQYEDKTGTSMACPAVSGTIALMLQKNPQLNYKQIYKAITSTAVTKTINVTGAQKCGGIEAYKFPNCVFGYGRIDALNAVNAV